MYIKKLNQNPNNRTKKRGFTLVEMVIVAPIVILVIGVFIFAIINMVGAVMASRGSNTLAYNIQQALSQIDQDVSASSGYLAVNNVSLHSPQGLKDDDLTNFHNVQGPGADATNGTMLILNTYATTTNPISATRSYVYAIGQPYACNSTLVNQNTKITVNIIYFVKTVNGVSSLWRRTVVPSDYASAKCGVPWQQPTCSPGYVDPFCKTNDEDLVDGVQASGFKVNYFVSGSSTANAMASDNTQSNTMRQAAMNPTNTVTVEIDATATLAGRNISQTGSIRSINSNTTYVNSAPLSPVADWIATPQGDHAGNYYDLVTHGWANVSRTTPKTIYDSATKKIYDVPPNYLSIGPRSDGQSGSEAVIEEARTNYLVNSYFSVDSNSDGIADNWAPWGGGYPVGTPTYSRVSGAVYGSYGQRIQYTGVASDNNLIFYQNTAAGTFATGDSATGSVYIKGSVSGTPPSVSIGVLAYSSGESLLGYVQSSAITLTSSYQRVTLTYTNLPANTDHVSLRAPWSSVTAQGDTLDVTISAAQLEKGPFATSYIPTTTSTATRNADNVTVPTTNWNANAGTIVVLAKQNTANQSGQGYYYRSLLDIEPSPYYYFMRTNAWGGLENYFSSDGVAGYAFNPTANVYWTSSMSWTVNNLRSYLNGTLAATDSSLTIPGSLPGQIYVGSGGGGTCLNGSIPRFIIYSSQLSDSNVSTITNIVQNGP